MSAVGIQARNQIPLVVHLIYRLDFGGLETLLVDCINHMPAHQYRHAIVCLNGATAFAERITRGGVELFDLKKRPGLSLDTHRSLYWLLRRLRPAVLHTYNLAALEYNVTATLAGVPVRVHAEHGRDLSDPQGSLPFSHDHYVKVWQLNKPVISADYILLDEAQDTALDQWTIVDALTEEFGGFQFDVAGSPLRD